MATAPEPARRIRCDRCESTIQLTPDELLEVSRGEWPRCCLSPMILEVEDDSVNPSVDTDLARPSRRSRRRFAT
jgi:hypothetical protein